MTDPPIRERLVWHGLRSPNARDLGDVAVVASALGAIFSIGGVLGLLVASLDNFVDDEPLFVAVSVAACLIGLTCLIGYRRLPPLFFPIAAACGIGLISVAGLATKPGSEAVFAPAYAFIVMLGLLFFPVRTALAEGVLALAAYGFLLSAEDTPFAEHLLFSSALSLISLAVVINVVRTRVTRIADELTVDAYLDPLTRIPNRRSFDARFEIEVERTRRDNGPLSLVICDLDYFKRVNDEFGHETGDLVLERAARAIAGTIRSADHASRIGGEEFGLILPSAEPDEAATAAERVRDRIAAEFAAEEYEVTISCGVASAPSGDADEVALYAAADEALYEAKRAGRNCTAIASGDSIRIVGGGTAIGRLRQVFS